MALAAGSAFDDIAARRHCEPEGPPMLSIQHLTHVYPNGTRALDDVTLEIPRGMFGLLGPNGAGKSSLMRCLATLQIPSSGAMRFGDIDILSQPASLRATLGYLPQDFGVYPRVSALAMLDHLQQVNLWDVRKRAIAGFSGGMRQRFGIAQALIGNPQLIIVDEPTAGLDPEERNRFNNLLAEIGESRVVILSTHIVDDVTDLCSRMAILVAGRIVASDTPAALIGALDGRVFSLGVDSTELPALRKQFQIISTRLRAGRTQIHVLADERPDPRFETVVAQLEDVYFATLHRERAAAVQAA
jgi:ABC-2 type transport system ATP-binding protein